MPLNAPNKPAVRHVNPLDQAVRRHRHGLKGPGQLLHGLVVAAVNRQILPAKQRLQRSARQQLYHMGAAVVGRFHAVLHLRGSFRWQVLVKSPAEHCIHQLMSPADAEHRLVPLHSAAQNVRVHAVPQSGHDPAVFGRLLSVQSRRNVLSAGQDESVAALQKIIQHILISGERRH